MKKGCITEIKLTEQATLYIRPTQADIWVDNWSDCLNENFGEDQGCIDLDKTKLREIAQKILDTLDSEGDE